MLKHNKKISVKKRKNFITNKKAVSQIYAALIALLIVIPLLVVLLSSFINYNLTLENQKILTEQKIQENLSITDVEIAENEITSINEIKSINVNNAGTIELKVRAIYFKNETITTFVSDPSVYISPASSKIITLEKAIPVTSSFSLTVSTERGTLSKEFFIPQWAKTEIIYDTENLTIGNLRLRFESFEYSVYKDKTESWGPYLSGWNPPMNEYIAWRLNITNTGNDTITLNNHSSLTLSSCDGPTEVPWYIANLTQTLSTDTTSSVIFVTASPGKINDLQKITVGEGTANMVFLTFFGELIIADPYEVRPYGQTIPFEAVIPGG